MLTDNQNKIISDLKEEFARINKTPSGGKRGLLIDRSEIDNIVSESAKKLAEIRLIEASVFRAAREKIEDDVRRLNIDLEDMGLAAEVKSDIHYARGRVYKPGYKFDESIKWNYELDGSYVTLPDGTTHRYNSKILNIYASFCLSGSGVSCRFKTIDDMFADDKVKRALIEIYKLECK